jgi:hypothetical protein
MVKQEGLLCLTEEAVSPLSPEIAVVERDVAEHGRNRLRAFRSARRDEDGSQSSPYGLSVHLVSTGKRCPSSAFSPSFPLLPFSSSSLVHPYMLSRRLSTLLSSTSTALRTSPSLPTVSHSPTRPISMSTLSSPVGNPMEPHAYQEGREKALTYAEENGFVAVVESPVRLLVFPLVPSSVAVLTLLLRS